ncbi:MAG: hypothetical protein V1870_05495 [Candidatus Aenigmatarchaeota archaeon]
MTFSIKQLSLVQICAILFIIGLICLFFIVLLIQPTVIEIKTINDADVGKTITINATIAKKEIRKENLFLDLKQNESYIKAVMFESNIQGKNLSVLFVGKNITIIGKIGKYMGELEIIIEDFR